MKIWFKRIVIGIVAALIVAVVGLAIFLLTFDPNFYKSKLSDLVYNKYHRTLLINGDIQLSLFPRIGLSLKDVSLSEPDSNNIFASVDSARFAVAIWPLLSNRFVVDHVSVSGLKAWVLRNKEGHFNFRDLVKGPPESIPSLPQSNTAAPSSSTPTPQGVARAEMQIDIAGLDLRGGEIHFRDERSGYSARVEKLQIDTGRMTFDQPFDVSLRGNLVGERPLGNSTFEGQALLRIDAAQRAYSVQKLNLQVTGRVGNLNAKVASAKGNLSYDANTHLLNAGNLELRVQGDLDGDKPVKGLDFSLVAPKLRVDQSRSELDIDKLSLRAKGNLPARSFELAFDAPQLSVSPKGAKSGAIVGTLKVSGDSVLGLSLAASGLDGNADNLTLKEIKLEGGLKQGDRLLRIHLSSPGQWDMLKEQGTLSAIKGDVQIEGQGQPATSFEFPFIGSVRADLIKDEFNSEINAVLSGSQLNFNLKGTQLAAPKLQFDLKAEALDIDKLFPVPKPPAALPAAKPGSNAKPAAGAAKPGPAPDAKAEVKPEAKAQDSAAKQDAKPAVKPGSAAADAEKAKAKPGAKPEAESAAKARPVAPAAAPSASAVAAAGKGPVKPVSDIDLSLLDSLDLTGHIKVNGIKGRGLEAKNLDMAVVVDKGKLDLSKLTADLYGGKLSGHLTADTHDAFTSQVALDNVAVGPLLQGLTGSQRISGTGDFKFNLTTQGATVDALKAGLGGTMQAQVRNGAVQGIDVTHTLTQVGNVLQNLLNESQSGLSNKFDLGSQTAFSTLDSNVTFEHGIGQIKKLDLVAPSVHITQGGTGKVDLIGGNLDVMANVRVTNAAALGLAHFQGVVVPVQISGPFSALGYQVRWKEITGQLARHALQNGLLDLLSGKAGTASTPATTGKKEDTVKSLGNTIRGLLGK